MKTVLQCVTSVVLIHQTTAFNMPHVEHSHRPAVRAIYLQNGAIHGRRQQLKLNVSVVHVQIRLQTQVHGTDGHTLTSTHFQAGVVDDAYERLRRAHFERAVCDVLAVANAQHRTAVARTRMLEEHDAVVQLRLREVLEHFLLIRKQHDVTVLDRIDVVHKVGAVEVRIRIDVADIVRRQQLAVVSYDVDDFVDDSHRWVVVLKRYSNVKTAHKCVVCRDVVGDNRHRPEVELVFGRFRVVVPVVQSSLSDVRVSKLRYRVKKPIHAGGSTHTITRIHQL